MGEKNFKRHILSESTHLIRSRNAWILPGRFLPKLYKDSQNFKFWIFAIFFFVNMGPYGKKLQTTSPLKVSNRFTPPNPYILLGRVSTKIVQRMVTLHFLDFCDLFILLVHLTCE